MNYIKLGQAISRAKVSRCGDNDYPVLSITMKDGIVMQSDKFKKRIASKDISEYKVIPAGMLVQGIHMDEGNFGIQDIVPYGIVSPAYTVWTVDESVVFPKYIEMVLRSPRCIDYYRSKLNGTVNRRGHMSEGDFLGMQIPCPSIEEQKHVVTTMNQVKQVMISLTEEMTALDQLIKARFVEMFGEETKHGVPLKECCIDVRGGGTPSMQHPEYFGGNVPFIKSGDVRGDMVSSGALWLTEKALEETTAKYVPQGSVLVVNRSAALLREFRAAIAARPVVINQDIKAFIPKHDYTSEYLLWAIKIQTQLLLTKVTTVLTSHIDLKDLLELRIANASIELQKEFSAFISQVDKSKLSPSQSLQIG